MRRILVTGGAGFIGSNLTLALQECFSEAALTVVDDFRSGDFRNLNGFRADFVTADLSRIDGHALFRDNVFDGIFHEASITDTTIHDPFLQAHDNIEGFRRLLECASANQTPTVYASSSATYYGPREGHKQAAAIMIYQLYLQMKAGKRPRVFRTGERKRDFVYVKDVVAMTMAALNAPRSGVFNCGCGEPFSFNDVITELNRALGTSLEPEYIEKPYSFYQPHTEADMTRAQPELGFAPKFPPARGIPDYVAFPEGKGI